MNMDQIAKFAIPLAFFAIWLLMWLFSREGKPLPGKVKAPTNPYALRPNPPAPLPRPVPTPARQAPIRWANQTTAQTQMQAQRRTNDDDIVILESPATRTRTTNLARGVAPSRKAKRVTPPSKAAAQPVVPKSSLGLTSPVLDQHMTIAPLTAPLPSLTSELVTTKAATAVSFDTGGARSLEIRGALSDPSRIREAFILNEILRAPLVLRGRRTGPLN